ncbi:hypothetical protein M8J76_014818 [Diaphorina citri]|nr:hypothetical protein M8J76_014818 [Diaphorina citri]
MAWSRGVSFGRVWFFSFAVVNVLSVRLAGAYKCPRTAVWNDVKLYLYSRYIPDRLELKPYMFYMFDLGQLGFNRGTPTKLITHGFTENPGYCESTQPIIEEFKKFFNYNLILVDWSALSGRKSADYPKVVSCVRTTIAPYVGAFLNYLMSRGVRNRDIHLIGHSLGGQLMGVASKYVYWKVQRITALDPAGPFFDRNNNPAKLRRYDAFVPGCSKKKLPGPGRKLAHNTWDVIKRKKGVALKTSGCDHHRSYQIFAYSINPQVRIPSRMCFSVRQARSQMCNGPLGYAGYHLGNTAPGIYYTNTTGYYFRNIPSRLLPG